MTAVSSVQPTGDAYIDGILSGVKWASNSLTFSFPTDSTYYGTAYGSSEPSNNFEAFTVQQQDAVRAILQMYSSMVNLTFTEVTETSTQHGELRYAESDAPGTAWAYYPSTSSIGGDAWFNYSRNYYDNPIKGNYAYLTMMHETGHALGLKHPHEVRGSFGAMPADKDSLEYTVMSYHSYVGSSLSGYTNGTYSYPQTLMMYDIAALQDMYGANYSTNSGNTVYTWSSTTGQMFVNGVGQGAPGGNTIFMTVWDGGGNDTYDFSNYTTSLSVDINPGSWTTASTAQLATLAYGHYAVGNIANALLYQGNPASLIENAVGGSGNDVLIGNMASNRLIGGEGNDILDGGDNADVMQGLGGNDWYYVDNAGDRAVEAIGGGTNDRVLTSVSFKLEAGSEIELFTTDNTASTSAINLTGNEFANSMIGNAGNNIMNGGGNADVMQGLGGNDTYFVDNAADRAFEIGGNGFDIVRTTVDFALEAGSEIEVLSTTNDGGLAAINLTGNAFGQTINGNAGANILNGLGGNDTLTGFGGSDNFRFTTALNAATNVDQITDFNVVDDTIQLDHAVFLGLVAGVLDPNAFRIGAAAADADDRVIYNDATGALIFDSNGNDAGGDTQFATLSGGLLLTHSDFIVF